MPPIYMSIQVLVHDCMLVTECPPTIPLLDQACASLRSTKKRPTENIFDQDKTSLLLLRPIMAMI